MPSVFIKLLTLLPLLGAILACSVSNAPDTETTGFDLGPNPPSSEWYGGACEWTSNSECTPGWVESGLCSSNCQISNRVNEGKLIKCCPTQYQNVKIDEQSEACAWQYAKHGNNAECAENFAVAGSCDNDQCDGGNFAGVYCCPYTDNV